MEKVETNIEKSTGCIAHCDDWGQVEYCTKGS